MWHVYCTVPTIINIEFKAKKCLVHFFFECPFIPSKPFYNSSSICESVKNPVWFGTVSVDWFYDFFQHCSLRCPLNFCKTPTFDTTFYYHFNDVEEQIFKGCCWSMDVNTLCPYLTFLSFSRCVSSSQQTYGTIPSPFLVLLTDMFFVFSKWLKGEVRNR